MSKEVKITMDRTRAEMMKRQHNLNDDEDLWWLFYEWSKLKTGDTFKVRIKEQNGKLNPLGGYEKRDER